MNKAELVHLDIADQVATITLDSEHNRNALSRRLVAELEGHLATASEDTESRAILIRSSGRVFCSGADLSEASEGGMTQGAHALVRLQRQIATSPKPVVVEVGGPVRAGGLGIVGAADIVIAAESVTFQLTEVRLGLAPVVISLSLLPRLGDRAAADLFLTARVFDAAEAVSLGLVTRAVPDDRLGDAVAEVLAELALGSPQGLRETKRLLNHDLVARIDTLGDEMAKRSAELFGSAEAREAMKAFLQRRR
ncbi:enoyl-CoA hydratase-related protein [Thermopolyspora sp. NPDC052614]|uniref:enoyl-CoA hydratase-related protein n=1 Tax=Thermopolyspora sp. NPDC052614 TaxID=3155682 RepID=UPI00341915C4